jgi:hypothetical protein
MRPANEFVDYVLSFYGHGEMFDMGMTRDEVLLALGHHMNDCEHREVPYEGDTFDREAVRDLVVYYRGLGVW